jgi:hypothetical protein
MKGSLQQMLERLFARQTEEMEARAEVHQNKADAKVEAAINSIRSDLERSLHQQMEALLEEWRFCGKGTTACLVPQTSVRIIQRPA